MATDTLSRIKGLLKGLVLVAFPRPRRVPVPPAEARRGLCDCYLLSDYPWRDHGLDCR